MAMASEAMQDGGLRESDRPRGMNQQDEADRDRASIGKRTATAMKTLFLNPPSYEGFDGGAGSRYQARREVRSFWYPTWLAQAAALVPDSTLIDAPADELTLDDVLRRIAGHELAILHTSTPSVDQDAKTAAAC